jgi:hypothetical protein
MGRQHRRPSGHPPASAALHQPPSRRFRCSACRQPASHARPQVLNKCGIPDSATGGRPNDARIAVLTLRCAQTRSWALPRVSRSLGRSPHARLRDRHARRRSSCELFECISYGLRTPDRYLRLVNCAVRAVRRQRVSARHSGKTTGGRDYSRHHANAGKVILRVHNSTCNGRSPRRPRGTPGSRTAPPRGEVVLAAKQIVVHPGTVSNSGI